MTRNEWENELKKCMKDLPAAEQTRVLEYYAELFADGLEFGKSEKQLINEFGNPADVAFRIISEYGMDERRTDERAPAPPDRTTDTKTAPKKETPPDFWAGKSGGAKKGYDEGPPKKSKPVMRSGNMTPGKLCAFIAEIILVGWLPLTIAIVVTVLLLCVPVIGASLAVGSIFALISSFMPALTAGVRIVVIATALVSAGLAILILPCSVKIVKAAVKCDIAVFKGFFGWIAK